MRGLAGSLESLNSIGGDSVLLRETHPKTNGEPIPNGTIKGPVINGTNGLVTELTNGHAAKDEITASKRDFSSAANDGGRALSLSRSPMHSVSSIDFSPSLEEVAFFAF